ncbi:MAG TPA: DUF2911 domain-containing protein [Chitinophagaceae bacterium]|jgi:hypothetical protein|nr:DUF2911 domain-containing protein [Chitinophagaceae bacterium]
MKRIVFLSFALFYMTALFAQMDLPPSGNNPRATVSEEVGITSITIKYSRPDVNKREGKIWGEVITWGFTSLNLNTNKSNMPWRAGANENTFITFEHDVKVEGKNLRAGTYGLHMAVWPDSAVLIFSTQSDAWGSFYYDEKYDVLRVTVKPVALDKSVEYLKYEFIEHKEKYCVIALQWEKISIPFKVEVDVDNIVIARLREQVTSQKGFNAFNMLGAAQYALNKNINLDEALGWSQRAALTKTFATLNVLGTAYTKLNRLTEADSTMKEALVLANVNQYIGYGRLLIAQKRNDKALEIMLDAKTKFGDVFAVNNGLMFAYSAKGDFKNAIASGDKASAQAANAAAKKAVDDNIVKLKEGKDIN